MKVTFGLKAFSLDQAQELGVTATKAAENDGWQAAGNLEFEAKVVYNDTEGLVNNTVLIKSEGRMFYAPGSTDLTNSYLFELENFAVDGTSPTVSVEWNEAQGIENSTRYYNTEANVTFTVAEENPFAENNVVISYGDGTSDDLGKKDPAKTYVLTKNYKEDGTYNVVVDNGKGGSATDLVGLQMLGAEGTEVSGGKYAATVVIDKGAPELVVSVDGVEVANGSELRFDKDVTIRAEVTDPAFDAENSTFAGETGWKPVPGAENTFYIEKTLAAGENALEEYTPAIHVQDKAANTTDFSSKVVVDKVIPVGTLTFDLGGGTLDGKTGSITIEANVGATIKLPGAPTRESYTFKFWKGSEYAAGADYKVEGDHAFTAEWEKDTKPVIPKTGDAIPVQGIVLVSLLAALIALAACIIRRRLA